MEAHGRYQGSAFSPVVPGWRGAAAEALAGVPARVAAAEGEGAKAGEAAAALWAALPPAAAAAGGGTKAGR